MGFTAMAANRIGRIRPGGRLETFELPPDTKPKEIVASPNGRRSFTMEGRQALGSIRAVLRPGSRYAGMGGRPAEAAASPSAAASSGALPSAQEADWGSPNLPPQTRVGWYPAHGTTIPTHSFVVVTSKLIEDGIKEHDIMSAYPVSDRW